MLAQLQGCHVAQLISLRLIYPHDLMICGEVLVGMNDYNFVNNFMDYEGVAL